MVLWFPFFLLGLIHVALPYFWVKRFVEKILKRPVFWSGAKLGMLLVILPLWNLVVLAVASNFICASWPYWLLYFMCLNLVAHGFHRFITTWKIWRKSRDYSAQNTTEIVNHRKALIELIKENGL